MEKFYKIAIPKPCHEDWNTMVASEKGKFCNSCTKTVIDFTTMSPPQIQHFIKENQEKKICGHFKKAQLDTIHLSIPFTIIEHQHSYRKSFLLALLIIMGTTLVNCTNHEGKQQKIEAIKIIKTTQSKDDIIDQNKSKKCSNRTSRITKSNTTNNDFFDHLGFVTSTPVDSIPDEPVIEANQELEGEVVIMGYLIPESIDSNQPIPAHLLDIFPALTGTVKEKRTSENFQKLMSQIVNTNFNKTLGNDLGLIGIQRIYVQYEINKNGTIENIKIRATHPKLEKETERVLKKTPKLEPAIYQGNPVSSLYQLPIVFKIEE
ncbi:energy transducer TonB [Aquimarina pacifica]|uniref:energy transducer TonB n=1 Tax=Aquimarina pacifica TaxID=1296415 RepID=UPI00046F5355|nr:energy transducer TonB [Aquimarina pacifica]